MFGMHRNWLKRPLISNQRTFQLMALVLFNGYAEGFHKGKIFKGGSKAVCVPVLNCYSCPGALGACPIGSLQTALAGVKGHFPFYVLGLMMLFGILLGRVICGLLCPFGLVQDLFFKIPVPKLKIVKKIDKPARYLKYIVLLVLVFLLPAFGGPANGITPPYFCKYICPAGTLGGGIPNVLLNPEPRKVTGALFDWKMLVLASALIISTFVYRPFCRYLCPLGAFYSLFNRISFYQIYLDKDKCVACKKCENSCLMSIEITKITNSFECIRCGRCTSACPTQAIYSGWYPEKHKREGGKSRVLTESVIK